MRTFFIPNALGHAVLRIILTVVIVAVVALVLVQPTYAQDTVITDIPDPGSVIDRLYADADEFLQTNEANVVIGLLAFAVIAGARFILPDTKLDTERIIALVVGLFTAVYLILNAFGHAAWLENAVEIGAVIGQSVGMILSILGVSGLSYLALGKGLKFPLVARSQGDEWFHMADEPELIEAEITSLESYDLATEIAEGVAKGLRLAG